MKCEVFKELINLSIDGKTNVSQEKELKEHLNECKACKEEYDDMIYIKNLLSDLPVKELPENFNVELHDKLVLENQEKAPSKTIVKKSLKENKISKVIHYAKKHKKLVSLAATFILIVSIGVGMEKFPINSFDTKDAMTESSQEMEKGAFGIAADSVSEEGVKASLTMNEEQSNSFSATTSNDNVESSQPNTMKSLTQYKTGRLIIKSGSLSVDVENHEAVLGKIKRIVEDQNGYFGNMNTSFLNYNEQKPEESLKYSQIRIRIPNQVFDQVFDKIKALGVTKNETINSQDITKVYRDTASKIENYKVRENKLRDLMSSAEDINDILSIERELTRVRNDIDQLSSNIKNWENLVDMSTINLRINEVEDLTKNIQPVDNSLGAQISRNFILGINQLINSTEHLIVSLALFIPKLITFTILGVGIYILINKVYLKKEENNEKNN